MLRFVWRNDPYPTYLDVLNVGCAISPETRDHTDTHSKTHFGGFQA